MFFGVSLLAVFAVLIFIAHTALAAETVTSSKLIVPKLNVPIPDLVFSDKAYIEDNQIYIPFFAQYVSAFFKYILGAGLIAASIVFVWGGMLYIYGATGLQTQDAKKKMVDALIGLVILLGSYTILANINPNTLTLGAIKFQKISTEEFILAAVRNEFEIVDANVPGVKGRRVCDTLDTCRQYCCPFAASAANGVEKASDYTGPLCKQRPDSTSGMAAPSDLKDIILDAEGLTSIYLNKNGTPRFIGKMRPEAVDALLKAGKEAKRRGFLLKIVDTYRPLAPQIDAACRNSIIKGDQFKAAGDQVSADKFHNLLGHGVAFPGSSNHGTGSAVDLMLIDAATMKSKTPMGISGGLAGQIGSAKALGVEYTAKILPAIMESAGFKRLCIEAWHYEFGVNTHTCDWPPPVK